MQKSSNITLATFALLLCMPTLASAACGDSCKQKCANAVSQGREPTQAACERKWSALNANQQTQITNAAGQTVTTRRAHNYAECIKFGNSLGYSMDQRISYCHQHFAN
jgi:hypothetical protein